MAERGRAMAGKHGVCSTVSAVTQCLTAACARRAGTAGGARRRQGRQARVGAGARPGRRQGRGQWRGAGGPLGRCRAALRARGCRPARAWSGRSLRAPRAGAAGRNPLLHCVSCLACCTPRWLAGSHACEARRSVRATKSRGWGRCAGQGLGVLRGNSCPAYSWEAATAGVLRAS